MKTTCNRQLGFTLLELLIVIAIVAFFAALIFPGGTSHGAARATRINCVSNLKQIGTAYLLFAADHDNLFPSEISTNKNGTMEFVSNGQAFKHFQSISNELSSVRVLICPADTRIASTNFTTLNNSNLSYFVGLDVSSNNPGMLLSGDRNLTLNGAFVPETVVRVRTNDALAWTDSIHKTAGNIGLADGSVQQCTSTRLNEAIKYSGTAQRLSFP